MRGWLAVALVLGGAAACGSKRDAPPPSPAVADALPRALGVASVDAAPMTAPAPVDTTALTLRGYVPICVTRPDRPASYAAALAAGRAAATSHRWVDAAAALSHAQAHRPADPISASELSWALLMVGDPEGAYQAVKPALVASDRTLAAAAYYHAARAAEALGWLDIAAEHYRKSLALRDDDAVETRLVALDDAVPPSVPARALLTGCVEQPTADAVCACLRSDLSRLPGGRTGTGFCHWSSAGRAGGPARARVAVVSAEGVADSIALRTWLVLVAERGGRWSALTVVAAAPGAVALLSISAVGDLVVAEASTTSSEQSAGARDIETETHLSICRLPAVSTEPTTCFADVPVAQWTYQTAVDATDGQCAHASGRAFTIRLTDGGIVTRRLLSGADPTATGDALVLGP